MLPSILKYILSMYASILFTVEGASLGTTTPTRILYGLTSSNGGGFLIRDMLLLSVTPSLLSSPLELFIYIYCACANIDLRPWNKCLPLLDLVGIEIFICSALFQPGQPPLICIACGFFTGIGGGLITAIIRKQIHGAADILTSNRVFALLISILVYSCRGSGRVLSLVILPIIFSFLNGSFRHAAKERLESMIDRARVNDAIWKAKPVFYQPILEPVYTP